MHLGGLEMAPGQPLAVLRVWRAAHRLLADRLSRDQVSITFFMIAGLGGISRCSFLLFGYFYDCLLWVLTLRMFYSERQFLELRNIGTDLPKDFSAQIGRLL